jgi:hypothetical protein
LCSQTCLQKSSPVHSPAGALYSIPQEEVTLILSHTKGPLGLVLALDPGDPWVFYPWLGLLNLPRALLTLVTPKPEQVFTALLGSLGSTTLTAGRQCPREQGSSRPAGALGPTGAFCGVWFSACQTQPWAHGPVCQLLVAIRAHSPFPVLSPLVQSLLCASLCFRG